MNIVSPKRHYIHSLEPSSHIVPKLNFRLYTLCRNILKLEGKKKTIHEQYSLYRPTPFWHSHCVVSPNYLSDAKVHIRLPFRNHISLFHKRGAVVFVLKLANLPSALPIVLLRANIKLCKLWNDTIIYLGVVINFIKNENCCLLNLTSQTHNNYLFGLVPKRSVIRLGSVVHIVFKHASIIYI